MLRHCLQFNGMGLCMSYTGLSLVGHHTGLIRARYEANSCRWGAVPAICQQLNMLAFSSSFCLPVLSSPAIGAIHQLVHLQSTPLVLPADAASAGARLDVAVWRAVG